jgi:hypothetical protein
MADDRVRWQYRVVNIGMFGTPDRLAAVLSQLGAGGWELVHVYDKASNWLNQMEKGFAIFKRAVPSGVEPDGPWAAWNRATKLLPAAPKGGRLGGPPTASWLPDPTGRYPDRWWDGARWSEWVRDEPGGNRFEDPPFMDLFEDGEGSNGGDDEVGDPEPATQTDEL